MPLSYEGGKISMNIKKTKINDEVSKKRQTIYIHSFISFCLFILLHPVAVPIVWKKKIASLSRQTALLVRIYLDSIHSMLHNSLGQGCLRG